MSHTIKEKTIEDRLQDMVAEAVEARFSAGLAREDAMVGRYGEYVKLGEACRILGVSSGTVYKLRDEGLLVVAPRVGVSVRSMAHLGDLRKTKGSPQRAVVRTSASMRVEP